MGGAMLSKSLIQLSVDEWGCVPSVLFDQRPNYGGGDGDNSTSFKRSRARTATLSAPTLQQATTDPRLCWRLLDTPGQVWVSLSWGHCSFLLGQVVLVVKNPPVNAGDTRDMGLIPGSRTSPGAGSGIPLQYSCLEILCAEEPDGL